MPRYRSLVPLALALSLAACAPPRVVKVGLPGAALEESPYAGEDIHLRRFAVRNVAPKDQARAEKELRDRFKDYLKAHGKFRDVRDAGPGAADPPKDALVIDVDLQAQIEDSNVTYNKVAVGIYGLYSFTPRSGNLRVIGNAVVTKGGRAVSSESWTASQSYSYALFGMFRTGPIEKAFQAAYEEVFSRLAVPLRFEGGPAVSKAELQDLVKESIKEASKKPEKAYASDVDAPAYRLESDPRNYALVIGIEKYAAVPQADFGERDAQAVKEHLLALGYPQRNVVHLAGSLASRANIEKYVESWLPQRVAEDSRVFVYFSGHGAPDVSSGQAYLVPWDGDVKFLQNTGYSLARLYEKLNGLKAKTVLVALDSCFSGAGGRSVLPKGTRPLVTNLNQGSSALGRLAVLAASQGDEIAGSDESQGHGVFTYHLLKGLNERNGSSSLKELYDYIVPRVQDAARSENRDQTPQLLAADPRLPATVSLGR